MNDDHSPYEAPSVEEIDSDGPISTAAGQTLTEVP